jgi:hypothetical protein
VVSAVLKKNREISDRVYESRSASILNSDLF